MTSECQRVKGRPAGGADPLAHRTGFGDGAPLDLGAAGHAAHGAGDLVDRAADLHGGARHLGAGVRERLRGPRTCAVSRYRLCVQFEWMGLNVRYGRCTIRLGCCARFGGVVFVKKRAVWAIVVLSVMLSAVPAASAASWSLTPVPSPDGASASLSSVSCASAKLCVAVGQTGSNQAFSAVWRNGRWSIVPVAAPSGVLPSNLSSVSCAANGRCVAVGGYCTDFCQGNAALSELFNGTGWVIEPTPPSTFEQDTLSAVSCSSAS